MTPAVPPPAQQKPRVLVLLYPGCIFFEIASTLELLAPHCGLILCTPQGAPHAASNGTTLAVQRSYAQAVGMAPAAVVVPGGDPDSIFEAGIADACLRSAQADGAVMAGICAGALVLARAGVLRGHHITHNYTAEHTTPDVLALTDPWWAGAHYQRVDWVADRRVITAQHWAHAEFAAAIALALGVVSPERAAAWAARRFHSYARPADGPGGPAGPGSRSSASRHT